jgi:hypothetical protein
LATKRSTNRSSTNCKRQPTDHQPTFISRSAMDALQRQAPGT